MGPVPGPGAGPASKRKWEARGARAPGYPWPSTGTTSCDWVKSFNAVKGFGFIICEVLQQQGYPQDVFLGQAHAPPGCQGGNNVNFTAFLNDRGQPQAKNVEIIS
eukprot:Skav215476  [mRNA]  locus=scaffold4792:60971:66671:+ [translate_table: standard]